MRSSSSALRRIPYMNAEQTSEATALARSSSAALGSRWSPPPMMARAPPKSAFLWTTLSVLLLLLLLLDPLPASFLLLLHLSPLLEEAVAEEEEEAAAAPLGGRSSTPTLARLAEPPPPTRRRICAGQRPAPDAGAETAREIPSSRRSATQSYCTVQNTSSYRNRPSTNKNNDYLSHVLPASQSPSSPRRACKTRSAELF